MNWLHTLSLRLRARSLNHAASQLAKRGVAKRKAKRDAVTAALACGGSITVPNDSVVNRPWPQSRYRFSTIPGEAK